MSGLRRTFEFLNLRTVMNHKHVLLQCLAALTLFAGPAQAQPDPRIRDVIVQGYGKDVADAAQNAAQNALTQVVGSFIDAEKFLAKRIEIQDGVRKETRDIRTDVREYSQGVIKSFEVVEVKQEALTVVTARVAVRIDDSRVLVKRVTEGSAEISPGLFAQMKTEERQSGDQAKMLHQRIFRPLIDREHLRIRIDNIRPLTQSGFDRTHPVMAALSRMEFSRRHSPTSIVSLKATVSFDDAFLAEMAETLNELSSQNQRVSVIHRDRNRHSWLIALNREIRRRERSDQQDPNRLWIALAEPNERVNFVTLNHSFINLVPSNHTPEDLAGDRDNRSALGLDFVVYTVSSANLAQNLQALFGVDGRPLFALARALNRGTLTVELKDRDARVIKTMPISANDTTNHHIMIPELGFNLGNTPNTPWNLVYADLGTRELVITPQRSFYVFFAVDDDALRNTASITARLEK